MATILRSFLPCFRVTGEFCSDRRTRLRKSRVAMAMQNETYLFYISVHPIPRFPLPGSTLNAAKLSLQLIT